ncbi:hypothetical protein [Sporolactobacillus laevolacticus]|uniref:hypothetical protein n=1 Tax=Sporolactobacillus laevolacticus TaxID=33018 RepID=UPI0025B32DFB|nr:hypothetical protein [Sporolactobacillus laevolacticus]MDN3954679.1 hypothetical protein [Sporolactobacillus laevolacticus]
MYKRTAERIVGIIGLVIAGFQTGAGILSLVAAHSSVLKTKMLSADSADHVPCTACRNEQSRHKLFNF